MKARKFLLPVLISLFTFNVFIANAQNKTSLSGTVLDGQTKEVLLGANVYFTGTSIGAITDLNGDYIITGIPAGTYELSVSYIGYETYTENMTFTSDQVQKKDVSLSYSGGVNLADVVITAQAKGQIASINQQLNSEEIKNVVSSDRIQELPDANAAESLGRLPGVNVKRGGGEGNTVVIRGMSPKYNKIMVDGIELSSASSTGSMSGVTPSGSNSHTRGVGMSMISSYSLDGIEVTKSSTADKDADFVGGMVNFKLKTAEDGFHADVVAAGAYNHLKNDYNNYNFVGMVSNRFFNDKLGLLLMGNMEKRNRGAHTAMVGSSIVGGSGFLNKPNELWTSGLTLKDVDRTRIRKGGTMVLDYRIKNGSLALKNFVSAGSDDEQTYSQVYNVYSRTLSLKAQDRFSNTTTISNLMNYEQQFGRIKIDAKLSHSYAEYETPNELTFSFVQGASALPGIPREDPTLNPDDIPTYNTFDVTQIIADGFTDRDDLSKQRQYEVSANGEWAFSISEQISGKLKTGGKYRHKDKSYDVNYRYGYLSSSSANGRINDDIITEFPRIESYVQNQTRPYTYIPFEAYMDQDYERSEFMDGKYGDLGPVADIDFMHDVYDFVSDPTGKDDNHQIFYRANDPESKMYDLSGYEDLYAAYLMGTFNITRYVDFIPGVRYEQNNTVYTGPHGDDELTDFYNTKYGSYKDTTVTRQNSYFLPMIQLKVKPTKWLQIHMGYTQTLARPDYSVLVPKLHIGSGSSPIIYNKYDILPERSTNYDINVSVHQNYIGLFSVGAFAKDMTDKIFWAPQRAIGDDYADYNLSKYYKGKQIITQYNDSNTVKVRGLEFEWQTQFWYLPGAWKGLVLNVNTTVVFSEAQYPYSYLEVIPGTGWDPDIEITHDTAYTDRLIDQPNNIWNVSLGYDYKGFSARISMLYNTDIFSNSSILDEYRSSTGAYTRWDLSLKQDLPVEGLQVFLNMNNITGTKDKSYIRGASYPTYTADYGMTVDLGIRWKM